MSNFGDRAKQIISTVAPVLGGILGGPLGGLAGTALSEALGTTDPKAQEAAIVAGNPDTLLKLKQADADLQTKLKQLDIDADKLRFDDTANARAREIATKDRTPAILGYAVTAGFFGILSFMLWKGVPAQGGEALLVMLGALSAAWTSVCSYFWGSSAGSSNKDTTIQQALNKVATK